MRIPVPLHAILLLSAAAFCISPETRAEILLGPWPAPNSQEEAAIAAGEARGVGSARLEGPDVVEVYSHQRWVVEYQVGEAGLVPGGSVLIGLRHMQNLACLPQWTAPTAEGYVTVSGPEGARLELDKPDFPFARFFPWQHLIRIRVVEGNLSSGDTIRVVLGDLSEGGPGMRVQPFDEPQYVFKVFVDPDGRDTFYPLRKQPSVAIVAGEATELQLILASNAVVDAPIRGLVRAVDRFGNPAGSYRGEVTLRLEDEVLAEHTFGEADNGVWELRGVTLPSAGVHRIRVSDGDLSTVSNPVEVTYAPVEQLLLWGELHGHTLFSDGRGTVEEFYEFAEHVSALDFCAVTDHAFQVRDEMWEASKRISNDRNNPGRFVTFNAFEWSGLTAKGGDHNVIFRGDDPPIFRSSTLAHPDNLQNERDPRFDEYIEDVYAAMKDAASVEDVFCIPHYGGRKANPEWHDPHVERMIEIFSEHRRSVDWADRFLRMGHRLGIMASSDGHYGNPGNGFLLYPGSGEDWSSQEIGMAGLAVFAESHTRDGIFDALRARRVYASSGDRILLQFTVNGAVMGSEIAADAPPVLHASVIGTGPLDFVEIRKNSIPVLRREGLTNDQETIEWTDEKFATDESAYYYFRVMQRDGEEAISSPVWVN